MPALYPVWQALRPSSADAGVDRVTHARVDLLVPLFAAEDAVVAYARLHMVRF